MQVHRSTRFAFASPAIRISADRNFLSKQGDGCNQTGANAVSLSIRSAHRLCPHNWFPISRAL